MNNSIVRGLEYYNNIVFEVEEVDIQTSQSIICGGGNYDSLFEKMGGNSTSCFGFGIGIDRLLPHVKLANEVACCVCFFKEYWEIVNLIRINIKGFFTDLSSSFSFANKNNIKWIIICDDKINHNIVSIKNLDEGLQQDINIDELKNFQF